MTLRNPGSAEFQLLVIGPLLYVPGLRTRTIKPPQTHRYTNSRFFIHYRTSVRKAGRKRRGGRGSVPGICPRALLGRKEGEARGPASTTMIRSPTLSYFSLFPDSTAPPPLPRRLDYSKVGRRIASSPSFFHFFFLIKCETSAVYVDLRCTCCSRGLSSNPFAFYPTPPTTLHTAAGQNPPPRTHRLAEEAKRQQRRLLPPSLHCSRDRRRRRRRS